MLTTFVNGFLKKFLFPPSRAGQDIFPCPSQGTPPRSPDHDKRFFVEVDLNGTPVGSGQGRSKKEAEQMAAKAAIGKLGG